MPRFQLIFTTMFSSAIANGSSRLQGALWGRHARDWAEVQEAQSKSLYTIVLKALNLHPEQALLDAGCGAGLFCQMAAIRKGASVMGLDASSALIELARKRAPRGTFFEGEMEALPFVDGTFDVVTMLNSLHHTVSHLNALKEARRVLRPGGRMVIAAWARPEQCNIAHLYRALDELLPVGSSNTPAAFAFSDEGALRKLVSKAGFAKLIEAQATAIWNYPNEETALRGLLSASNAVQAADCAGLERVREVARKTIAPYRLPTGGYRMENAFHYIIAQRS